MSPVCAGVLGVMLCQMCVKGEQTINAQQKVHIGMHCVGFVLCAVCEFFYFKGLSLTNQPDCQLTVIDDHGA